VMVSEGAISYFHWYVGNSGRQQAYAVEWRGRLATTNDPLIQVLTSPTLSVLFRQLQWVSHPCYRAKAPCLSFILVLPTSLTLYRVTAITT
jgi:hypothetical protein